MKKIVIAMLTLMVVTASINVTSARTRIIVRKDVYSGEQQRQHWLREHPYAVEIALAAILCQFARYSVPPGQQAGMCPPRPEPR